MLINFDVHKRHRYTLPKTFVIESSTIIDNYRAEVKEVTEWNSLMIALQNLLRMLIDRTAAKLTRFSFRGVVKLTVTVYFVVKYMSRNGLNKFLRLFVCIMLIYLFSRAFFTFAKRVSRKIANVGAIYSRPICYCLFRKSDSAIVASRFSVSTYTELVRKPLVPLSLVSMSSQRKNVDFFDNWSTLGEIPYPVDWRRYAKECQLVWTLCVKKYGNFTLSNYTP